MYETLVQLDKTKCSLKEAFNYLETIVSIPEYDKVFNTFHLASEQSLMRIPPEFRLKRLFEVFFLTESGASDPNIRYQRKDTELILEYLIKENFDRFSPQLIIELILRLYPSVLVALNNKIKLFELKERCNCN